jgi:alpha-L-rhamnosidase
MYGKIASDWKIERETFEWRIVVPPNTVATVFVPTSQAASVRESGCLVAQAEGITLLREESEAVVLKVVPGTYIFSSPWSAR